MTVSAGTDSWRAAYRDVPVLVLGASGFIGRWVSRYLSVAGAELHLGVRSAERMESLAREYGIRGHPVVIDLDRDGSLEAALRGCQPAIVFNLTGYGVAREESDPGKAQRINADSVGHLVSDLVGGTAARGWSGLRLVQAGSVLEYGPVGGDLDEGTVARPDTVYGRSKLEGTAHVVEAVTRGTLDAVVARLFTVYGPGEHPGRLLPTLIAARKTEGPVPLTLGTQQRDFLWVGDVASGLLRLGATPASFPAVPAMAPEPILNLCTGRLTEVRSFVCEAAALLGIPEKRLGFGLRSDPRVELEHAPATVSRLRARLGWVPGTTPREGIRRTLGFLEGVDRHGTCS